MLSPKRILSGILEILEAASQLLTNFMMAIAGVLIFFMAFLITYSVISRYFFGNALGWVVEIIGYSVMSVTLLGAPWVLKKRGHVRIEIILSAVSAGKRRWMELLNTILGLLTCTVLLVYSFFVLTDYYLSNVEIVGVFKVPKYLLVIIIVVGVVLLITNYLKQLQSDVYEIRSAKDSNSV